MRRLAWWVILAGILVIYGDGRCSGAAIPDAELLAAPAPTRTVVPVTATTAPVPTQVISPTPTELPAPGDLVPQTTPDVVQFLPLDLLHFLDHARDDLVATTGAAEIPVSYTHLTLPTN